MEQPRILNDVCHPLADPTQTNDVNHTASRPSDAMLVVHCAFSLQLLWGAYGRSDAWVGLNS